jgi:hypothetical protein
MVLAEHEMVPVNLTPWLTDVASPTLNVPSLQDPSKVVGESVPA